MRTLETGPLWQLAVPVRFPRIDQGPTHNLRCFDAGGEDNIEMAQLRVSSIDTDESYGLVVLRFAIVQVTEVSKRHVRPVQVNVENG